MALAESRLDEFRRAVKARTEGKPVVDRKGKRRRADGAGDRPPEEDVWMREAERLAKTVGSLQTFLGTIRRAYLSTHPPAGAAASSAGRGVDPSKGLAGFENVRWLSDAERDMVDLNVATGIRGCVDGVRSLEAAEKARQARKAATPSAGFLRILGLPASQDSSNDVLAAHRASVLWYLNQRLTVVGKTQKDLQEARMQKHMDRSAIGGLGGAGTKGMNGTVANGHQGASLEIGDDGVPAIYKPARPSATDLDPADEPPIDSILTAAQIQQFESESSALLQETQQTLASLHTAEASLLEISALQSELVVHLTQQGEVTDQLWEDAIFTSGKVEEGNKQLKIARERNRESRIWLLIFLIGASLALLFVDYIA